MKITRVIKEMPGGIRLRQDDEDDNEKQLMDAWSAIEKTRETKKDETVICPDCGRKVIPIIKNGKKICPHCGIHRVYEKFEYE